MKKVTMLLLVAATAVAVTGCSKKSDNMPNSPGSPSAPSSMIDHIFPAAQAETPGDDAAGTQSSGFGQTLSDSGITTKVKAALAADAGLKTLSVHVTTTQGVVTLTGKVKSQELYNKVASVVQSVGGVKSVNNMLEITPSS